MRAIFEITEATAEEVTVECEALDMSVTIEMTDAYWREFDPCLPHCLEHNGSDLAEWALRVATVGAAQAFVITPRLDERLEGLAGIITAVELRQLHRLQEALTPEDESGAAEALEDIQAARLDGGESGWRAPLAAWAAGEYQTTSLTDSALATLAFFGWVVIQERATTVVVGDESGWWLTGYAALNGASLSRMERAEIGLGEARWDAHDSWCDAWNGEMFDGEE